MAAHPQEDRLTRWWEEGLDHLQCLLLLQVVQCSSNSLPGGHWYMVQEVLEKSCFLLLLCLVVSTVSDLITHRGRNTQIRDINPQTIPVLD